MLISFNRVPGAPLDLSVTGDTLTANGAALDMSAVADGDMLPMQAVSDWPWLVSDITRADGVLHLTIIAPYAGGDLPESLWYPEPVMVNSDGPVDLPAWEIDSGDD